MFSSFSLIFLVRNPVRRTQCKYKRLKITSFTACIAKYRALAPEKCRSTRHFTALKCGITSILMTSRQRMMMQVAVHAYIFLLVKGKSQDSTLMAKEIIDSKGAVIPSLLAHSSTDINTLGAELLAHFIRVQEDADLFEMLETCIPRLYASYSPLYTLCLPYTVIGDVMCKCEKKFSEKKFIAIRDTPRCHPGFLSKPYLTLVYIPRCNAHTCTWHDFRSGLNYPGLL